MSKEDPPRPYLQRMAIEAFEEAFAEFIANLKDKNRHGLLRDVLSGTATRSVSLGDIKIQVIVKIA